MIDTPSVECGSHAWGFGERGWRRPCLPVQPAVPPGRCHKLTASFCSVHIPSSDRGVAAVTSQRLTSTCLFVVPPPTALRDAAAEMQEGAPGGEAAEPAQQAGAGGPEHLPPED